MAQICNTSNISSTYFGGGRIYSVQSDDTVLENGYIGVVGKLADGEREIREISKITDITQSKELVLVDSPEIIYDNRPSNRGLENFVIPIGVPARAYSLEVGDEFSVSIDAIENLNNADLSQDIGKYVTLKNNTYTLEKKDNDDGTAKLLLTIEGFEDISRSMQLGKNRNLPRVTKLARLKIQRYVYQ